MSIQSSQEVRRCWSAAARIDTIAGDEVKGRGVAVIKSRDLLALMAMTLTAALLPAAQFGRLVRDDYDKYARLARELDIKAN
jgi:hypothetical protein